MSNKPVHFLWLLLQIAGNHPEFLHWLFFTSHQTFPHLAPCWAFFFFFALFNMLKPQQTFGHTYPKASATLALPAHLHVGCFPLCRSSTRGGAGKLPLISQSLCKLHVWACNRFISLTFSPLLNNTLPHPPPPPGLIFYTTGYKKQQQQKSASNLQPQAPRLFCLNISKVANDLSVAFLFFSFPLRLFKSCLRDREEAKDEDAPLLMEMREHYNCSLLGNCCPPPVAPPPNIS